MAKKQVKRWYVRRIAFFNLPTIFTHTYGLRNQRVAITHKGLEALERAVKKGR